MEFGKSQTAVENRAGCRIICGVPTTLAVKGLMMMMMVNLDNTLCLKLISDLNFKQIGELTTSDYTSVS